MFNKTLRCIAIISADGEEDGFKTKWLKLTKITWTTLRENSSLLGKHKFKQNLAILKIHFLVSARFFRARWKKNRFLQIYIFLGFWGKNNCCCQNWFLCVQRSFLRTKDLLKKIWNMSFFPKLKELFGLLFPKLIATRSKEYFEQQQLRWKNQKASFFQTSCRFLWPAVKKTALYVLDERFQRRNIFEITQNFIIVFGIRTKKSQNFWKLISKCPNLHFEPKKRLAKFSKVVIFRTTSEKNWVCAFTVDFYESKLTFWLRFVFWIGLANSRSTDFERKFLSYGSWNRVLKVRRRVLRKILFGKDTKFNIAQDFWHKQCNCCNQCCFLGVQKNISTDNV